MGSLAFIRNLPLSSLARSLGPSRSCSMKANLRSLRVSRIRMLSVPFSQQYHSRSILSLRRPQTTQTNHSRPFGVTTKPSDQTTDAPYGLKIPDYSTPPPKWPLPPPPPIGRTQTILVPLMAGLFAAGAIFVYFNQDEDIYDYWQQVEQGNVPVDDDDDDDEEE